MHPITKGILGTIAAAVIAGAGASVVTARTLTSSSRSLRWLHGLTVSSDETHQWLESPPGGIAEHPGRLSLQTTWPTEQLILGPPQPRSSGAGTARRIEAGNPQPVIESARGAFTGHLGQTPRDLGLSYWDTTIGPAEAWHVPATSDEHTGLWAIHLHGLGSTRSQTLRALPVLADQGVTSLVPTFPLTDTYGRSVPRRRLSRQSIEDLHRIHDHAIACGARQVVYVGWSIAAALVLHHLHEESDQEIAGALLVSPVLDLAATISATLGRRGPKMVATVLTAAALRLSGWCYIANPGPQKDSDSRGWSVPVLMLCAENDQQIPIRLTHRLAETQYPEAKVVTVPRAHHTLEWNAAPEMLTKETANWIHLMNDQAGGQVKGAHS